MALTEKDFEVSDGDLYIRFTQEIYDLLKKNYRFFENIEVDYVDIPVHPWYKQKYIQIPFAADDEWELKNKVLQTVLPVTQNLLDKITDLVGDEDIDLDEPLNYDDND